MSNIRVFTQGERNQTQTLNTKCEVCGGTREALAIRRTLFYSVARRVELFYLSRDANYEPRPSALTADPSPAPPCLSTPGPSPYGVIRVC